MKSTDLLADRIDALADEYFGRCGSSDVWRMKFRAIASDLRDGERSKLPWGFNFVDVVSPDPAFAGSINLLWGDHCLALVRSPVAEHVRKHMVNAKRAGRMPEVPVLRFDGDTVNKVSEALSRAGFTYKGDEEDFFMGVKNAMESAIAARAEAGGES